MFGKSKSLAPPPKPPTYDQIVEDLQTFDVARPPRPKVRTVPDEADFDDWWKVFETFSQDLTDLKELKANLMRLKSGIEAKNTHLTREVDTMKTKMEENIAHIDKQSL
jgi:hypothetical protein